ncbi:hypothetical protein F0562_007364 [Nyssa sinensis]|uniref:Uncharacterized protein n=1 Tax=Nyssa sinensis TaxID=561372 RepID=A0A5J5A5B4_9ASTE|nr:hypothetical protein F0562_007364 [Nyssa sinensis]
METMHFVLVILLNIVTQVLSECVSNKIGIGTVSTGRQIQGKHEWKVTVTNNCDCPQAPIYLNCKGFQPVKEVEPPILEKRGDQCLLINGRPLGPFASISFSYGMDSPFVLTASMSECVLKF